MMADEVLGDELKKHLNIIQSMIDVSAERLEGLRTQCATSAELTQQEIRTLESKLIRLFSDQLHTRAKLRKCHNDHQHIPSLTQWLQVVGLSKTTIQALCQRIESVDELQEKTEKELGRIMDASGARIEELARLCRAVQNLRLCTNVLRRNDGTNVDEMDLSWDSWDDRHPLKTGLSPRAPRTRQPRPSVSSEEGVGGGAPNNNNNRSGTAILASSLVGPSSSVSSINSLNAYGGGVLGPPLTPPPTQNATVQNRGGKGMKFPTTPPPRRKHRTGIQGGPPSGGGGSIGGGGVLMPDSYPLTKSKSHESQLAASNGSVVVENNGKRGRLSTEPGPETITGYTSPSVTSPIKSPPCTSISNDSDDNSYKTTTTLPVPKSPRTPTAVVRNMTHQINHRFQKTFKMMSTCGYCLKPILFCTGLKCKECKYTCHPECEDKVAPSCGLPPEFLDEFKKEMSAKVPVFGSPRTPATKNTPKLSNKHQHKRSTQFPPPDSSSNTSSCNSSTPSSPAVQLLHTPHTTTNQRFKFPDVQFTTNNSTPTTTTISTTTITTTNHKGLDVTINPNNQSMYRCNRLDDMIGSTGTNGFVISQSQQSDERTASVSGSGSTSTDSDRTPVRVDSQDSQASDTETITEQWPRQNSLSMREWDIPYKELTFHRVIGIGRFGEVYAGYWHGDVAIKLLNMRSLKDDKILEQFKTEVSTFRKTRHENLVLFMGACMKPPELAVVTSLIKGLTLYTHIHLRKDKFNMNKTTIVAQQISQGMGYLHAKGIVHKDLKTKNIFLENGKVVISDFGLFSVTKLCFGNRRNDSLGIPAGWLCYLSPEVIRKLYANQSQDEELPFSNSSDVYAFGTVYYELLCGEWPFKGQPPEAIIWQVGKGMKQPLANLQASRDVKDILMLCWSFRANDRPDFAKLLNILDRLPKKRLARSPSHPIHMSRSAESVF